MDRALLIITRRSQYSTRQPDPELAKCMPEPEAGQSEAASASARDPTMPKWTLI
jgi:hypothetical protein